MKERDSRPDMAGLVNKLEEGASDPPLEDSDAPEPKDPSTPPPAREKRVDPDKLLAAWVVMTDVQKQLVRVIQRNERDNRATRLHNTVTRSAVIAVLFVAVVGGWYYSDANSATLDGVATSQSATSADVEATLKAVRAVSEAVGAKVEAETEMHPAAEEEARKKAVEAQEEALAAEVEVARDPGERASAAAKLVTVRKRKAHGRADPVMPGEPIPRPDDVQGEPPP